MWSSIAGNDRKMLKLNIFLRRNEGIYIYIYINLKH